MTELTRLVGEKLKAVRKAKGFTQEQIAERAEISDSYVSDVERGQRNISLETLEKLIRALDISPEELFHFDGILADNEIQEKKLLVELHKSQLMAREIEEVRYVVRTSNEFLSTVDQLRRRS